LRRLNHLILTVDVELFGNGSGCVNHCVLAPLERMAAVAEAHNARLELFVEALEFVAMGASPEHAKANADVKRVLADLLRRGHKLQLHLHPQWHGARYESGTWVLELSQWRTGNIAAERLLEMLGRAEQWLCDAVVDVVPDYRCTVFRAGGWCIQPSAVVIECLRSTRMRMDSSVAPGMMNRDATTWYDFLDCPRRSWWPVRDDVTRISEGRFLEVPIAAGRVNPLWHLAARLRRSRHGEFAAGCRGSYHGRSQGSVWRMDVLRKIWYSNRAMLDYCALPANLLIDVTRDWTKRVAGTDHNIAVVAIGHTKNFSNIAEREMTRFLQWSSHQPDIRMSSYDSWERSRVVGDVRQ
jgi:hypothetical protein